jgi:hypothetical protein
MRCSTYWLAIAPRSMGDDFTLITSPCPPDSSSALIPSGATAGSICREALAWVTKGATACRSAKDIPNRASVCNITGNRSPGASPATTTARRAAISAGRPGTIPAGGGQGRLGKPRAFG